MADRPSAYARMVKSGHWENWARTETFRPRRVLDARYVEDVVHGVRAAREEGLRVKALGAGHSFTGAASTDGLLVRLDEMRAVISEDLESNRITVQAGITLRELNSCLHARGLALSNLGDIDAQTISGAVSTGTHGTGSRYGGLATQVCGLEIVLADGTVVTCGPDERPDLFAAARVGLGALGIITAVSLQCEPAYLLHAVEKPAPLQDILADIDALVEDNDYFEFYWFPHTERTLTKQNNRVPPGTVARPLGRLRGWFDDEFMSNRVFAATNRLCTIVPALTPAVNAVASRALTEREYVERSYRVFCSPRRVMFREIEYAIPRSSLPDVLAELRRWIDSSSVRIPFPVEIRFAASDDIWLSTAYGRETAYVAVHQFHRLPYERYFRAFEAIALEVGGRPHWGKLHWLHAAGLRERYVRFDDFVVVRSGVDPSRAFANRYLDRVLGA